MEYEGTMGIRELFLRISGRIARYDASHNFTCDLCGREVFENERLCNACRAHLPKIELFCPFCGRRVREEGVCLECKKQPLVVAKARSVYCHEGGAAALVLRFKRGERYLVYTLADDVFSIGDYVLTGGELAALVVIDSVVRLLPGALGDEASSVDESFSQDSGLLEYAQYTRPSSYRGMDVPEVLLSGDHGRVAQWRRENAIERTARWRPDLLESARLDPSERARARELMLEGEGD